MANLVCPCAPILRAHDSPAHIVIGVVCRVQRITDDAIAPDMGYAIPVRSVQRLIDLVEADK